MLKVLGELVGFSLEALSFALVELGLTHAGTLTVAVGVLHFLA